MRTYKYLLLGIFVLVGLSVIFITPSRSVLELFNLEFVTAVSSGNHTALFLFFLKYPPGVVILLSFIVRHFPLDQTIPIHLQTAWVIHKFILYFAYLTTWISLLKFAGLFAQKDNKDYFLDVSLLFSFSVPILQLGVSLAYFEILAVSLFVLSLYFLLKKKTVFFVLFYCLTLTLNWTILFLLPIILVFKKTKKSSVALLITLFLPWVTCLLALFNRGVLVGMLDSISDNVSFNPFFHHTSWFSNTNQEVAFLVVTILMVLLLGYLFNKTLFLHRWLISYVLSSLLLSLSFWFINGYLVVTLTVFTVYQLFVYYLARSMVNFSVVKLFPFMLAQYALFLVFFPFVSEGNYLWLSVLGLMTYIADHRLGIKYLWMAINITIFFLIYLFMGVSGAAPVKWSGFFDIFRSGAVVLFLCFISWLLGQVFSGSFFNNVRWLKIFTVIFLIVVNISHLPALGDPDTISWAIYAKGVIRYADPFLAHVKVNQFYAPLSTIIIGFFALLWKNLVGISNDYLLATKIGIVVFSLITIIIFFKRSLFKSVKTITSLDKIFVIITCFSLSLQTLGMADINIFLIPPLFMAVVYLYRGAFFKSGLFFALSVSIKWQPLALLPLFGVAIFNFDKPFKKAVGDSLLFLLGFLPLVVGLWWLVIIQPEGVEQFRKTFQLYTTGGVYLSGQAMNLNWVVTYLLHVFWPHLDYPLSALHGLNRQIYPGAFPHIFRGFLFQLAMGVIVFRYWFFQKKNIFVFLEACVAILFSHHMLNSSAMELHLFYPVIFMLFLYFLKPNLKNRSLLNLFNVMSIVNIMMFYGFTGDKWFNRLFLGFDITVAYAVYYLIIYFWFMKNYFTDWETTSWRVFRSKA